MRGLIGELVSAHHQVTIVDMEAGLEHFSRSGGTLRYVDQLLIITEMDHKALETARRTHLLARDLGIERVGLIGNKLRDDDTNDLAQFCKQYDIELIAAIPFDESARQADRRGVALYDYNADAVTVRALEAVMTRLEKQFELLPAQPPANEPAPSVVTEKTSTLSAAEAKPKCFPDCN